MFKFLLKILDYVYRRKCYFCRTSYENTIMCQKCYDNIQPLSYNPVKHINGVKVYSASSYTKEMQKLIRGLKYHNQRDLAYFQAKFMYEYFIKTQDGKNDFVIIPVPLHKKRHKKRKYNHMELVAEELSKLTGWSVNTELIVRVKETKPQYKLKKFEREENLKDAFKILPQNYNGENLLIIDDILTTGSTFNEMIKTLNQANINKITCLSASTVYASCVNVL